MPLEDSDKQLNGEISVKEEGTKSEKTYLQFDPRPQRVWKLNRRGFYMSGRTKETHTASDANSQKSDLLETSSKFDKQEISDQEKASTPGKKIIKLNNSKKYSLSGFENTVKRTLNGDQNISVHKNSQETCEKETPPKKKHKPITWP